jgi:hypothetical protein
VVALLAAAGIAAVAASGCGSDKGAAAAATPAPQSATPLELAFERASASREYSAAELDVRRVVVFHDRAPADPSTGFACESAGGVPLEAGTTARLDLATPGTTSIGLVQAPPGNVAELWLLHRARIVKRGTTHVAHGELKCRTAESSSRPGFRSPPAGTPPRTCRPSRARRPEDRSRTVRHSRRPRRPRAPRARPARAPTRPRAGSTARAVDAGSAASAPGPARSPAPAADAGSRARTRVSATRAAPAAGAP